jgi:hypothetical protein
MSGYPSRLLRFLGVNGRGTSVGAKPEGEAIRAEKPQEATNDRPAARSGRFHFVQSDGELRQILSYYSFGVILGEQSGQLSPALERILDRFSILAFICAKCMSEHHLFNHPINAFKRVRVELDGIDQRSNMRLPGFCFTQISIPFSSLSSILFRE